MLGFGRERPEWFDQSTATVLDGAEVLIAARGPRELDDAVSRLLGGELHRRLLDERAGLWFDWWFTELAEAAKRRTDGAIDAGDHRMAEACARLLYAMTGLGSPGLAREAYTRLNRVTKTLSRSRATSLPQWLRLMPKIAATGDLWQMCDAYGGRFGVVAGFRYPGGVDSSVYLFDIDACGFTLLVAGGSYDDVDRAAEAWRAHVGLSADGVSPEPVREPKDLRVLVSWDAGDSALMGDESRQRMDDWFRAIPSLSGSSWTRRSA